MTSSSISSSGSVFIAVAKGRCFLGREAAFAGDFGAPFKMVRAYDSDGCLAGVDVVGRVHAHKDVA